MIVPPDANILNLTFLGTSNTFNLALNVFI